MAIHMIEREPRTEANDTRESILAKEIVETILRGAQENLRRDGSASPVLFLRLESGEKGAIALALPETPSAKAAHFNPMGQVFQRVGIRIHEALFVSESWYVSAKKDKGIAIDVRPSQHPDRKEAIVIVGRNAKRTRHTVVIQPFSRDIELMPVFEEITIAEFNKRPEDLKSLPPTGLLDYLFPIPLSFGHGSGLN